ILSFFSPAEGAEIGQGQAVAPGIQCIDDQSSIASCGPSVGGHNGLLDTSTLGPLSVTVTATNGEGDTTSITHHYTVVPMPAPITYYVDPGGTFTPIDPTSHLPVHAGTP